MSIKIALIYSVSSMGILVMSIPFDCSLLVSLFFHLEPICEPKSGQLKTDPARSPLPVTQLQLHIQVSFWSEHEFDLNPWIWQEWQDQTIPLSCSLHIFFSHRLCFLFWSRYLLKMNFRLRPKADKKMEL